MDNPKEADKPKSVHSDLAIQSQDTIATLRPSTAPAPNGSETLTGLLSDAEKIGGGHTRAHEPAVADESDALDSEPNAFEQLKRMTVDEERYAFLKTLGSGVWDLFGESVTGC